jgi:hypothetical protein
MDSVVFRVNFIFGMAFIVHFWLGNIVLILLLKKKRGETPILRCSHFPNRFVLVTITPNS